MRISGLDNATAQQWIRSGPRHVCLCTTWTNYMPDSKNNRASNDLPWICCPRGTLACCLTIDISPGYSVRVYSKITLTVVDLILFRDFRIQEFETLQTLGIPFPVRWFIGSVVWPLQDSGIYEPPEPRDQTSAPEDSESTE